MYFSYFYWWRKLECTDNTTDMTATVSHGVLLSTHYNEWEPDNIDNLTGNRH